MPREFIGRVNDIAAIRREIARQRPSLIIVLGRRRVGKSTLILESVARQPSIYYQATKIAPSESLALFKAEAAKLIGSDPVFESVGDWHAVLLHLARNVSRRLPSLVVTIDEFPYLCEADAALPSVFQKVWDAMQVEELPLNLVLCGSKISFMEGILAEKNPLHGRQTLKLDVEPLPYRDAAKFFPGWSDEDKLRAFGVFGGIPYYLGMCDPAAGLAASIVDIVLSQGAPLATEPENLLQAEFREVERYATILRAIGDGCTTSGEIIGRVREFKDASAFLPYVQRLAEMRLARIDRSLDASPKERDRRYYINDPFLSFWYRFCLPNLSALASGHAEAVYRHAIAPLMDQYMGDLFEWICRDHARLYGQEILPAPAREVGKIWSGAFDLDVAGQLLDGSAIYGECKWWSDPVGENVLEHLIACSNRAEYGKNAASKHWLVYSRSGFTDGLVGRASADPSIYLISPETLIG